MWMMLKSLAPHHQLCNRPGAKSTYRAGLSTCLVVMFTMNLTAIQLK